VSELPPFLAASPRLSAWLGIRPDGTVEVRSGRVEFGQGVLTAMAQIAAEELDVDLARIRLVPVTTGLSPDEGWTAGSLSIQYGGAALRVACADTRGIYLATAGRVLGADADTLTVTDGEITAPDGRVTSFWELADDALLDTDATGTYPVKSADGYTIVGTSASRVDQ
jgi:CO/xanthine dehydrogenase Mo-binding subunit